MASFVPGPHSLYEKAIQAAKESQGSVSLPADQLKAVAEWWHRDQEKIKYLESLIVRMAKAP